MPAVPPQFPPSRGTLGCAVTARSAALLHSGWPLRDEFGAAFAAGLTPCAGSLGLALPLLLPFLADVRLSDTTILSARPAPVNPTHLRVVSQFGSRPVPLTRGAHWSRLVVERGNDTACLAVIRTFRCQLRARPPH